MKVIQRANFQMMWPVWTTPQLLTWERNGVVLIGDAAHTLPPTSGQGLSQALEDAECLSMLLGHCLKHAYQSTDQSQTMTVKQAIRDAAKKYMEIRQPRIKSLLDLARRFEDKKRNLDIFEEYMMYLGLFIAGRLPAPSWLTEVYSYNISEEVNRVIASEIQSYPN
ncbi:hypothetical protein VTO42DRAFT_2332 [Malbranchea cinnamomea]